MPPDHHARFKSLELIILPFVHCYDRCRYFLTGRCIGRISLVLALEVISESRLVFKVPIRSYVGTGPYCGLAEYPPATLIDTLPAMCLRARVWTRD